jgi:superfamily I DNA and/or RNA helicase
VQEFADRINRFGAMLPNGRDREGDGGETWVGCPLVVHRRCVEPMFGISNRLSYGGTMKLKTVPPQAEISERFVLEKSCWLDVKGNEIGSKNHFVEKQGKKALELITDSFRKHGGRPDLFVISPFTTVIDGMKNMAKSSPIQAYGDGAAQWLEENCGTVHRFQGREAGEVIFLLGCDAGARGAVNWVKPNILNVAVTRAKYRLYIIGDSGVWRESGIFQLACDELS